MTGQRVLRTREDLGLLLGLTRPLTTVPQGVWQETLPGRPHGVAVQRITLRTTDGDVPCLYLRPPGTGPWPGAVAIHQHDGAFGLGKSEPAGLAGAPEMAYAQAGARAGIATLVPDLSGFEERRRATPPTDADGERLEAFHLLARGSSLGAQHVSDVALCVTWLLGRPEVKGGIGLLGHSLGGQVAFFAAACDRRVTAAVISCGIGTVESFHRAGVVHNPAWYVPGLLPAGDSPAVAALAVGQRFRVSAGRHDPLFPVDGVRRTVDGFPAGSAQLELLDAGHALPPAVLDRSVTWLASTLAGAAPTTADLDPGARA